MKQSTESATELMIRCMEEFGEASPIHVLVMFDCSDGSVRWRSNIESGVYMVGLCESVKSRLLADQE